MCWALPKWHYPRCHLKYTVTPLGHLHSPGLNLSQQDQRKLLQELENFKENYTCGDACPVEGYETRRIVRCGDFVETQYFTFANGRDDWNSAICCYCCSDENVLSLDQMKKKFDTGGTMHM